MRVYIQVKRWLDHHTRTDGEEAMSTETVSRVYPLIQCPTYVSANSPLQSEGTSASLGLSPALCGRERMMGLRQLPVVGNPPIPITSLPVSALSPSDSEGR